MGPLSPLPVLSFMLVSLAFSPGARAAAPSPSADEACVAKNVYHEARGEGAAGMVAVANVVINRTRDGRRPCEVVHERRGGRCQFSWACKPVTISDDLSWARARAVARAVMGTSPPPDPSNGATFFNGCGASPAGGPVSAHIGRHCFYLAPDEASSREMQGRFEFVENEGDVHAVELRFAPARDLRPARASFRFPVHAKRRGR